MALLQAKQKFQTFEISLRDKPSEMLALSPKGTVPVFVLPDGRVLEESWEIMEWAFSMADYDGWWQRAQLPENLQLLRCNDGEFKTQLDRYKYPQRFPETAIVPGVARAQAAAALLLPLEAILLRQTYLGGAVPCATDLAIFPFVRQFAAVEPPWFAEQQLPAVRAWLDAWLGSALFASCMAKPLSQCALARSRAYPLPR